MKVIREFPLLDITPDAGLLASEILASGIIPRKAATDAAHIAIAAVHDMDFLMTWNCVHISSPSGWRTSARRLASSVRPFALRRNCWENRVMAKDYIVDDVRRVREAQAAKHGFDVKAILEAARKRQRRSGHKVVSFLPKNRLSA